ncbi:hypothetical protein [Yoonia sp. 2307UL14-13]|uniref:hypothetical protein n=1 Tax=Yoonia sp. 2307UL14-13 TaxID=3126506 RepID=UPI0030A61A93
MTHPTLSYTFEIDGITCGKMDVYRSDGYLRSVTDFETPAFGHVVSDFAYYHKDRRIHRARKAPLDWVDFTDLSDDAFPDCAYPLLIARALRQDFDYLCIDLEGQRQPAHHRMARSDDVVIETRDGQVLRRFGLNDGIPVHIDWGGAVSSLIAPSAASK